MVGVHKKACQNSAFTIVEMVTVVTMVAILSAIGFFTYSGYTRDARNTATKANIRQIADKIRLDSRSASTAIRSFVKHNSAYAMSGSVYSGQTLIPGPISNNLANYSTGPLDGTKLAIDPSKFSDEWNAFIAWVTEATYIRGEASNPGDVFQIAGTLSDWGQDVAYVEWTYTKYSSWDIDGLVSSPYASGAVTNGSKDYLPYTKSGPVPTSP